MKCNANRKILVLDCILLPLVPLSIFTNDDSMISTDKSEYRHKCGYIPGSQINCTPEPHIYVSDNSLFCKYTYLKLFHGVYRVTLPSCMLLCHYT